MNWLLAKVVRPIPIIAGILAFFYLIAVAALFGEQRSMLFAGAGVRCPSDIPIGYRAVQFSTSDGQLSSALYRPATAGHRTILFFHGNGDTARTGIALFEPLTTGGDGALLIEYPGYCANPGSPDEQGFYQEGEAAVSWLRRSGVDPSDLIVAGYSLGTGVATKVAADHPPAALILLAAYTSIADVAGDHFTWAPTQLLTRDRFASIDRIGRIPAPIFLIHGADDTLVLEKNSRALARKARDATLVIVPGDGHAIAFSPELPPLIARWVVHL